MANLQDILYKVSIRRVHGDMATEVHDLQTDSRKVGPGSLFIAQKGTHTDSHQFIPQVVAAGASTIICEDLPPSLADNVPYGQVEKSAAAAGLFHRTFYAK